MIDQSKQQNSRLPSFMTVAFSCTLVTLVGGLIWTTTTRRSLANKIRMLQSDRVALQTDLNEREKEAEQASRDQELALEVLGHCRTADDIPDFKGERILSRLVNGEKLVFYVPKGEHELNVTVTVESTPTEDSADKVPVEALPQGKQTWSVPLVPGHGYILSTARDSKKKQPLEWTLESNSPEFEPLRKRINAPEIRQTGASWSGKKCVDFPNRIELRFILGGSGKQSLTGPLAVGSWTRFGVDDGIKVKLGFDISISSTGPPVISASDVKTLRGIQRDELVGEYLGGGRYRANAKAIEVQ